MAGGIYWLWQAFELLGSALNQLIAVLIVIALQFVAIKLVSRSAEPSRNEHILSVGPMILGNFVVIGFGIFFALDLIAAVMGPKLLPWVIGALIIALYVWLVSICSRYPDLVLDGPNAPITSLPELGPTIMSGRHFLLSVGVLIWCLTIERPSPALSAFRAAALMILILLTQPPYFRCFVSRTYTDAFAKASMN